MDLQNEKCVMVIDEHLPLGIIANTAAIMGITLGKKMPEVVGADVTDKTGNDHLGIIEFPVPILKGMVDFQNRKREFGLLKAVGATQKQLKSMLDREIGTLKISYLSCRTNETEELYSRYARTVCIIALRHRDAKWKWYQNDMEAKA